MCGIGGLLFSNLDAAELRPRLESMQARLTHRGPDDRGLYLARASGTGLVQTRLAILDPGPAGHQPMASPDGRYHIVFNGEIYNFKALRKELEAAGEIFHSNSDTEVVLRLYERFGEECVREFDGMFALAIWDEREQTCFLARDPFGIKPLYLWRRGRTLAFASEVRALLAADFAPRQLCPVALRHYLLFGSVPEPETLLVDVRMLPAGHKLLWRAEGGRARRYWEMQFPMDTLPAERAVETARVAIEETVRRHYVSDVPVSIFLSGGIDSTALLALSKRIGAPDLRTFCISFDDPEFNEGDVASHTAKHFGAQHHDWRLGPVAGRELLREFLARQDQPSIDGFNTFCVARHAHEHAAKVVLSGLGGDEVFGGYPSFRTVPRMVEMHRWLGIGGPVRRWVGAMFERHSTKARWRRLGTFLGGPPSAALAYWAMRGVFTPPETRSLLHAYLGDGADGAGDEAAVQFHVPAQPTPSDAVSHLELTRYMCNQLLRDSDVMSMAWGLELRVPFVDRKLVDRLASIPAALRLAPGKRLLLDAVPEIPEWVANRPKRGFAFPFERWIADDWHDDFRRIEQRSPVRLDNWYRRWCLFTLEDFLERNQIAGGQLAAAA